MTIFSLDTNVLIALWDVSNSLNIPARNSLDRARAIGPLVISAPVFVELMAHPSRSTRDIEAMLFETGIEIDWDINEAVWRAAGSAFKSYVRRRIASGGSLPRRILADFLIGAHAANLGSTLLTMDRKLYTAAFPRLKIISA
jgi:predicted nucleic acid-binding protein